MKTLSEWIAYKNNGTCKGEFVGPSGAWSYRIDIPGGIPSEADLLLFISGLNGESGWIHSTLPLGRETFQGFVKHWKKAVHPEEWIAFARVNSLGSIGWQDAGNGIKAPRPDINDVEVWFKPHKEESEPLIIDGSGE